MVIRAFWYMLVAVLLLPLAGLLYLSFVEQWVFPVIFEPDFSLRAWNDFFGQSEIWLKMIASLSLSTIVALVATILGMETSRRIALSNKRWLSLAYFPYLLAPIVLASMWQVFFIRLGLSGSWTGVAIGQFLFIYPYAILFMFGFWNKGVLQMGREAQTLGANLQQVYKEVWLPLAKPFLMVCAFQCFLISWFDYGLTQMLGIGKVQTFTIQTMRYIQESDYHLAAVSAILLTLPSLILLIWKGKLLTQRPYD